jgi:hypothetical protein
MKRSGYICQLCSVSIRSSRKSRFILSPLAAIGKSQQRTTQSSSSPSSLAPKASSHSKISPDNATQFWGNDWTVFSADNAALVKKAQKSGDQILNSKSIPSEADVLQVLEIIKFAALQLASTKAFKHSALSSKSKDEAKSRVEKLIRASSASDSIQSKDGSKFMADILSLNEDTTNPVSVSLSINLLSTLAYKIVRHPPVFLTAKILETYVAIETSLHQISTLPEVLDLYAHKPFPVPDSSPIRYSDPNPSKASQAVPEGIANQALEAAIKDRELSLALDIISATYAMPAFRKNKFVRKALPVLGGLTITPFAVLPFAKAWGETSLTADPNELTAYAFLGMLMYVSTLSGIGFVAVTTANDQMERVTWIRGMPLRQRWLREEERAAADSVAMAWGFQESQRRGEEEGAEWEILKAWCARRGMALDASELMEGME